MTTTVERTDYQVRLALFARVMFWSFVTLRIGEVILYRTSPPWVTPNNYRVIVIIGLISLLLLASMRWLVLVRRPLVHRALAICDLIMITGCGVAFGATAVLAWNRPESAYTCLVYAVFMVMMRTIVVPSDTRLTAVLSATALSPLVIAAGVLALTTDQDVPGPAFFAGAVMYSIVAVVVACAGSHVIYGLRRQVDDAEIGQYKLIRRIGGGPTGEVYVAQHALLRRPTALKVVQPTVGAHVLSQCELAVQQMSQLRHHNTVAIYDYGRSPNGVFYVAMEYLEGINLRDLVERDGAQPLPRVIAILQQLCSSLHEAHVRGHQHGNLGPANVIVCERGGIADAVKVSDFGFARDGSTRDLDALAALAGVLLGCRPDALADCFDGSTSAHELATKLRGHAHPTWTQAQAREWWSNYRRTSDPFIPVPATLAVDLASRQ